MKNVEKCPSGIDEETVFLATHSFSKAYQYIEHQGYEDENVAF